MRTVCFTSGVKALAAVLLALAVTASAAAATRLPATLRLSLAPPTLKGTHFAPKERLRVVVHAGGRVGARSLLSSGTGTFSVSLAFAPPWDPCAGPLLVTVTGATDHASVKRPGRECPPPG